MSDQGSAFSYTLPEVEDQEWGGENNTLKLSLWLINVVSKYAAVTDYIICSVALVCKHNRETGVSCCSAYKLTAVFTSMCQYTNHLLQWLNSFYIYIFLEQWELRGIRDSGVLISWYTIAEWRVLLTFTSSTVLSSAMQMGHGFHCALRTWLVWCKIGFGICVSLLINGGKCSALCCHSSFESISREPWFFLCEAALHSPTIYSVWKMNF